MNQTLPLGYTVDFVLNLHFLMDLYRFFLRVNDKCWIVTGRQTLALNNPARVDMS